MELKLGWAIVAAVAVAGGIAWWQAGHPGYQTLDQKMAEAERTQATGKARAEEHALYRWHDANGVLQITDHPPKGRKYEKVKIRADQNIIPMSSPASPSTSHAPKRSGDG